MDNVMADDADGSMPVDRHAVMKDPFREGRGLERVVRWTRTVVVEGPADWVAETYARALADGVHIIGTKRDLQCRIEVSTEEWGSVRGMHGPTSNQAMEDLRTLHPDLYEGIHGEGTAKAHATHLSQYRDRDRGTSPSMPTTPKTEAAHVGQYL